MSRAATRPASCCAAAQQADHARERRSGRGQLGPLVSRSPTTRATPTSSSDRPGNSGGTVAEPDPRGTSGHGHDRQRKRAAGPTAGSAVRPGQPAEARAGDNRGSRRSTAQPHAQPADAVNAAVRHAASTQERTRGRGICEPGTGRRRLRRYKLYRASGTAAATSWSRSVTTGAMKHAERAEQRRAAPRSEGDHQRCRRAISHRPPVAAMCAQYQSLRRPPSPAAADAAKSPSPASRPGSVQAADPLRCAPERARQGAGSCDRIRRFMPPRP